MDQLSQDGTIISIITDSELSSVIFGGRDVGSPSRIVQPAEAPAEVTVDPELSESARRGTARAVTMSLASPRLQQPAQAAGRRTGVSGPKACRNRPCESYPKMAAEARLRENGIVLPEKPSTPTANYIPYIIDGCTVYVSGQTPVVDGKVCSFDSRTECRW